MTHVNNWYYLFMRHLSHLHFVFILDYLGYIMEKIKVGDLYLGDLMMNQNKY